MQSSHSRKTSSTRRCLPSTPMPVHSPNPRRAHLKMLLNADLTSSSTSCGCRLACPPALEKSRDGNSSVRTRTDGRGFWVRMGGAQKLRCVVAAGRRGRTQRTATRASTRRVPLAQLDRASASGAEGRRFESCRGHHIFTACDARQGGVRFMRSRQHPGDRRQGRPCPGRAQGKSRRFPAKHHTRTKSATVSTW